MKSRLTKSVYLTVAAICAMASACDLDRNQEKVPCTGDEDEDDASCEPQQEVYFKDTNECEKFYGDSCGKIKEDSVPVFANKASCEAPGGKCEPQIQNDDDKRQCRVVYTPVYTHSNGNAGNSFFHYYLLYNMMNSNRGYYGGPHAPSPMGFVSRVGESVPTRGMAVPRGFGASRPAVIRAGFGASGHGFSAGG